MTFGIIGNGFIVPRHKQAIQEVGGELLWVCDVDKDYRTMPKVDFVSICTPNYLHAKMARFWKNRGAIVLIEKPPVLSSKDLEGIEDVNVVLQLRYHPEIKWLKEYGIRQQTSIQVRVKRGDSYWTGWKGDEKKSGGVLFNIGIHYLDILTYILGDNYKLINSFKEKDFAFGALRFGKVEVYYRFEIVPEDSLLPSTRKIQIGQSEIELSTKDNLSYENLHTEVYKDILKGGGVKLKDCVDVIKLIEKL